ncbi:MAG: MBL fold metallo-hydrolase [Myxococcota bacterium]
MKTWAVSLLAALVVSLGACKKGSAPVDPGEASPPSTAEQTASPEALSPSASEPPASEVLEHSDEDVDENIQAVTAPVDETPEASCGGAPLTVTFYDAGQALAALVTLPDGTTILVDAGESPRRPGCGNACKSWHRNVLNGLARDLGDRGIDMVWITHQHSDHLGGIPGIARQFPIDLYIDNGRNRNKSTVKRARAAAKKAGARLLAVHPRQRKVPQPADREVQITPIVPQKWPRACSGNPNNCSIGLLITYCRSRILFTGDVEHEGEAVWPVGGLDIDLLQVSHHGADDASSGPFLSQVHPEYAVVTCADRNEGTNRGFCHPRQSVIERLTSGLGGPGSRTVETFDAARSCQNQTNSNWHQTPISDRLWVTSRDGEVSLRTLGDGTFTRF